MYSVSGVQPAFAPQYGGTRLSITGRGFVSGPGIVCLVRVGGVVHPCVVVTPGLFGTLPSAVLRQSGVVIGCRPTLLDCGVALFVFVGV